MRADQRVSGRREAEGARRRQRPHSLVSLCSVALSAEGASGMRDGRKAEMDEE